MCSILFANSGVSPPWWIRGVLILTGTPVSFFHGSNDAQKGMGLLCQTRTFTSQMTKWANTEDPKKERIILALP